MNEQQGKPKNPYARRNPYAVPVSEPTIESDKAESVLEKDDSENTAIEQVDEVKSLAEGEKNESDAHDAVDDFCNTDSSNSFYNDSSADFGGSTAAYVSQSDNKEPQPANGFSVASLVFSLASIVCCGGIIYTALPPLIRRYRRQAAPEAKRRIGDLAFPPRPDEIIIFRV